MSPSLGDTWIKELAFKITLALVRSLIFKVIHTFLDEGVLWFNSHQFNGSSIESDNLREDLNDETLEDSDGFGSV